MNSKYASSHTATPLLLGKSSLLRELPVGIAREQGIFFDAIRYTAQTTALAYGRLLWALDGISTQFRRSSSQVDEHLVVGALSDAWVIVDSVYRLRAMLRQMPGWKQKASGAQIFDRNTKDVETLRNFFQHLNNETKTLVREGRPLLGYVQWVSLVDESGEARAYILVPGTMVTFEQDVVIKKKERLGGPVGQARLVAAGTTLWFEPLIAELHSLVAATEASLMEHAESGPRRHADVIVEIMLEGMTLEP